MKSSWDTTRESSAYHFHTQTLDPRWDTVIGLGRLTPTWTDDIEHIVTQSKPATWATRGYKAAERAQPPEDLAAEEYDLIRVGANPDMTITHLNWEIPKSLQKISDAFAFDDCMNRIHVQMPGEVWNLHIDKLQKWNRSDPDSVMRIMIQLTPWSPGQFWEFGNYHWNRWQAGDVVTFDWQNVPHSTANAGHQARVTFQITGIKTDETLKFLTKLRNNKELRI